jgi:hypothetical protein
MAACGDGAGGGGSNDGGGSVPGTEFYGVGDDGNGYFLEIIPKAKAATGDGYILTIYIANAMAPKTSSGTITVRGNTITLSNGGSVTVSESGDITAMAGTFTLDGGGTHKAPNGVTSGDVYATGGGSVQETSGRLTITGMAEYNGKYVIATHSSDPSSGGVTLYAAADINFTTGMTGGRVDNGTVTLKVWEAKGNNIFIAYNGNHKASFSVHINDVVGFTGTINPTGGVNDVTFASGIANGTFVKF